MRALFIFLISIFSLANTSFAQLPSNVEKLEGKWRFKEGSGYEVWEKSNDQLTGYAYRVTKTGDTSRVEEFTLKSSRYGLLYGHSSYSVVDDSLVTVQRSFIGGKRKMLFINVGEDAPYSVRYKFGFFNRNKLKVIVHNLVGDEPYKFTLFRIKE